MPQSIPKNQQNPKQEQHYQIIGIGKQDCYKENYADCYKTDIIGAVIKSDPDARELHFHRKTSFFGGGALIVKESAYIKPNSVFTVGNSLYFYQVRLKKVTL